MIQDRMSVEDQLMIAELCLYKKKKKKKSFTVGYSRYGPLHLWSMSLMGHQVVVMVQCNYGPGHLWATT